MSVKKVLFIDDQAEDSSVKNFLDSLKKFYEKAKIDSIDVITEENLKEIANTDYDICFIDLGLTGTYKEGYVVIDELIKLNPIFNVIPIIIYSGSELFSDCLRCLRLGVCEYIVKGQNKNYSVVLEAIMNLANVKNKLELLTAKRNYIENNENAELAFLRIRMKIFEEMSQLFPKAAKSYLFNATRVLENKFKIDETTFSTRIPHLSQLELGKYKNMMKKIIEIRKDDTYYNLIREKLSKKNIKNINFDNYFKNKTHLIPLILKEIIDPKAKKYFEKLLGKKNIKNIDVKASL